LNMINEKLDCHGSARQVAFSPLTYIYTNHNPASASDMEKEKVCSSCGVRLVGKNTTSFPCPVCGLKEIGRCSNCRDQSVIYTCSKCGFIGP